MSRDTTELKTGVQLRTPDMDALCAWLTEEVTLWLDEDWIERDVHKACGPVVHRLRVSVGGHQVEALIAIA